MHEATPDLALLANGIPKFLPLVPQGILQMSGLRLQCHLETLYLGASIAHTGM